MASFVNYLIAGAQLLAGIFLTASGIGGGIGIRLIASGALSLLSQLIGGKSRKGLDSSTRYGFDNARNVTTLGAPIPIIYGEEVFAPPVLSSIVRIEAGRQVAYILYGVCQGEIDSLRDVKLNGLPISSFPDAYRMVKRGTPTQSATWLKGGGDDGVGGDIVVGGWQQSGFTYSGGTRIDGGVAPAPNETFIHVMRAEADEVWVTLKWPSGLYTRTSKGEFKSWTWYGKVYVKGYLEADTKYVEYKIPKDAKGVRVQGDFSEGTYGPWSTTANTQSDLLRMLVVSFATKGRYSVKLEGLFPEGGSDRRTPTISLVSEITNGTRAYENIALLAIRCPDTDQLGGALPTVTCRVRGRKVLDWRTGVTAWSRNPALCLADLLTNTRYGIGDRIFAADLDTGVGGTFRTFADRCDETISVPGRPDEARYQLDLVIDTIADASEWVDVITTTCLATLADVQGLLRLTEDRSYVSTAAEFDDSPATAGSVRHPILRDDDGSSSLSIRIAPEAERPNRVILKHTDRDLDNKATQTEVRDWVLDVGAQTGGVQAAGAQMKGGTSGAVGYLSQSTRAADRAVYYTQEPNATAFVSGEVVTFGVGTTSTRTTTSAPYRETPERFAAVRLVGVSRATQAQRIGRVLINGSRRRALFATWATWMGDANLSHNDVVSVTSSRLGLSAKRFTVLDVEFDLQGRGVVVAREHDDDAFAVVDRKPSAVPLGPIGTAPAPGSNSQASGSGTASSSPSSAVAASTGAAGKPSATTGSVSTTAAVFGSSSNGGK